NRTASPSRKLGDHHQGCLSDSFCQATQAAMPRQNSNPRKRGFAYIKDAAVTSKTLADDCGNPIDLLSTASATIGIAATNSGFHQLRRTISKIKGNAR